MNKDFSALKPALVWKHFLAICEIPHPSFHEEKIRQYIIDFAAEHSLECIEDEAHNLLVRKAATQGMENSVGVVMQAHLDMVPQKNNDKEFNFETDPIEVYIDGDWVTANGTTLGADNGIGVAAMLAVLEDKTLVHGPVEALFTATEESGMHGAFGLKAGFMQGDILLNLDSEGEGELYVGCAGGMDANVTFDYTAEPTPESGYTALELSIKGLKGGHSGIQIIEQRANANRLLFRFLRSCMCECDMHLCSVDGGGLRNAIPREAAAVMLVATAQVECFKSAVAEFEKTVIVEFDGVEDAISISVAECSAPSEMIPDAVAANLTRAVVGCPDGVVRMSTAMENLVQTSTNLARVISDGATVKLQALMRSSSNSEKQALGAAISSVFELAGASVALSGAYDGWNPNMKSPILKTMLASYEELYNKRPEVMAIHAGLECGIIGTNYPTMDMISFGPTICYPHSPDEKVEIESVDKFYNFLLYTLKNVPQK